MLLEKGAPSYEFAMDSVNMLLIVVTQREEGTAGNFLVLADVRLILRILYPEARSSAIYYPSDLTCNVQPLAKDYII